MEIYLIIWKTIICTLSQIIFYEVSVYGKLLFIKRNVPEKENFVKMLNCLSASIYKHYEGRSLLFLGEEMRDSIGEQFLVSGINATINVHDNTTFNNGYKQIIFFQPKLNNTKFKYNCLLSNVEKSSFFLILWPTETPLAKVSKLHNQFWKYRILKVASFIPNSSGEFKIYSYFPYTEGNCGSGKIVQKVDECTSTSFLANFNLFSGLVKLYNFHGCDITCFGNNQFPESVLTEHPNRTWNVKGNIVYALDAFKAHYNVSLTYINIFKDTYGWFYYNTSMQTMIQKYETSSYEFGFGAFTILNAMNNPELDYSFASNPECIAWAVPLFAGKQSTLWHLYVDEFPFLIWCFTALATFIAIQFILIARLVERKQTNLKQVVQICIMMVFSIFVDSPKVKSNLVSVRAFLFHWSLWSLVVRCAYEASLGSLMAVPLPIQQFKSHKEILDNNLRVAGGVKMYELVKRASTNSKVMKSLEKKFIILPPSDGRKVLDDIYDNRDLAVLQPNRYTVYSSGTFAKLRGLNSLAVVMRPCLVTTYAAPLLIRKGSIMSEILYTFISRIFEAGLMKYWKTKDRFHTEKPPKQPKTLTINKLYGAFIIYCIGIGLAVGVLAFEIVQSKLFNKTKTIKKRNMMSMKQKNIMYFKWNYTKKIQCF